jgi:hypothetical protein
MYPAIQVIWVIPTFSTCPSLTTVGRDPNPVVWENIPASRMAPMIRMSRITSNAGALGR